MFSTKICNRRVEHLAADVSDQGHHKILTAVHWIRNWMVALLGEAPSTANSSLLHWEFLFQR